MGKSRLKIRNSNSGFTLLELLASAAIVTTLILIAVPTYKKYRMRARRVEALDKMSQLQGALYTFYAQYGVYASCFGSMGVSWTGGWYGITAGAAHSDSVTPKHNSQARSKGAYCPDPTSGALTVGMTAFPPTQWGPNCAAYSGMAVGDIQLWGFSDIYVRIAGYHRGTCNGASANDLPNVIEVWELQGYPNKGLTISGPKACLAGGCAIGTTYMVD
jgi:type IV pilus assembly protein PilE